MNAVTLRILVIGAHPDDCEFKAGGVAALYRAGGHDVRFVSVTNGESGHHRLYGAQLVDLRRAEAAAAGQVLGIRYDLLDFRDGFLEPTLEARSQIVTLIRQYNPDLVLTHRPYDYHPDHRATGQLVCDASYLVTVPPVVPDVPALREMPTIAYLSDEFQKPCPFSPSIVVDIEPVMESVVDMLDCHRSQFYDWLAYNHNYEQELPQEPSAQRAWLGDWFRSYVAPLADKYRALATAIYGEKHGRRMKYIEAFEPCEFGTPLTEANRQRLFPFLPSTSGTTA